MRQMPQMTAGAQHHMHKVDGLPSSQVEGITENWFFWGSFQG